MCRDGTLKKYIQTTVKTAQNQCSWILRTFMTREVIPMLTLWKSLVQSFSSSPRYPLSDWFLPVFGTVDTGKGWKSQVCPRAIGGITTCHKMRHSLSLPTVTYICMGELPHFHHSPTTSFLHSQPIQAPPSGPGLVCAAGQMFIWDDPSATPLSWSFTKGVPLLYPQCGTSILFWGVKCFCWVKKAVSGCKPVLGRALAMEWVSRVIFLEAAICVGGNLSAYVGRGYPRQCIQAGYWGSL